MKPINRQAAQFLSGYGRNVTVPHVPASQKARINLQAWLADGIITKRAAAKARKSDSQYKQLEQVLRIRGVL